MTQKKLRAGVFMHNTDKEKVMCEFLKRLKIEVVAIPAKWESEEIRNCILKKGPWLDFIVVDPHPFDNEVTPEFVADLIHRHNRNVKIINVAHSLAKSPDGKIKFSERLREISNAMITSLFKFSDLELVIYLLFPRRYAIVH